MENSPRQDSPEIPSLIKYISTNEMVGFDDVKLAGFPTEQCQPSESQSPSLLANVSSSSNFCLQKSWPCYSGNSYPCSSRSFVWPCSTKAL